MNNGRFVAEDSFADGPVAEGAVRRDRPTRQILPAPSSTLDVALGPAADLARRALAGHPLAGLLSEVSVARAAAVLVENVRSPDGWLRALLAGLDAFLRVQGDAPEERFLAPVLSAAWAVPSRADRALTDLAASLPGAGAAELARIGFGPKIWFTANGVPVAWRPLATGEGAVQSPGPTRPRAVDRRAVAVEALAAAGLTSDEVASLRVADAGRLAPGTVFVPELLADPLAIRLPASPPGLHGSATRQHGRLVFLDHDARIAVLVAALTRHDPEAGCRHASEPLLP